MPPASSQQSSQSFPWYDWFTGTNEWRAFMRGLGGAGNYVSNWFSSAAGNLASGMEAGMVSIFGDLWDVIVGPIYVIIGALIISFTLIFAFRNQIVQLGGLALKAAA